MMKAMKVARRQLHTTAMKQTVSELCVPVPWGEIRGQVWGPDHGKRVLCLHGWSDNCGSFNSLIPLLPKECRFVAVDMAGHGLSSHRPPGVLYSFPYYVMDMRRVIDALNWSKFSIIGHSMGGNVGGLFSALYPEMVDALILLDSYGFLPTKPKELARVMRTGIDQMIEFDKKSEGKMRVYTYENAVKRLLDGNPSISEKSAHILLERGLVKVEGGVKFSRDFRINLKNVVRISMEQSLDLHSKIKAPVLLLKAEDGFDKLYDVAKQYTSTLLQAYKDRNHEVVTVPGNHHVHLNNPENVAPIVSDFLRTRVLSQSAGAEEPMSKL